MPTANEDFAARNPGASIFVREETDGGVMLAVSPRRLVMRMAGAFHSEHIVGVLQDAGASGILTSDDFCALVDMTAFTGVINWEVIPQITEVMPKGDSRNKNAYIVRNDMFATLAKINAVLFPKTEHATFLTEKEARTWLGWD